MAMANVGGVDRALRFAAGIAAIAAGIGLLGALSGQIVGLIVSGFGVILLLTAMLRFCPAYLPIGLSTCKAKTN
ncbi:MAG: DUF2892 domain-containing protein [Phycisphaeraceae bacterium]|nr:DUF2892 domain-containing protein [Phycisphaeraceae bacterium]